MLHLRVYESFLTETALLPFDPLKFKVAADLIAKQIGPEQKTSLAFPEIKEVFGRDDYSLRFALAQALLVAGKNYFPKNKYNPNPQREGDLLFTSYIGEPAQNLLLQGLGKDALVVLKPLVMAVAKDLREGGPSLREGQYFKTSAKSLPDVQRVKALLSKLPSGDFPV